MSEQASAQERTEEATPRKRQQARKKGTVAQSRDLTSAVVMIALLGVLPGVLGNLGASLIQSVNRGLREIPQDAHPSSLSNFFWELVGGPIVAFIPLVGILMAAGVATNFAQVGFVLSAETLTPNLNKLNPVQGLKRLFSARSFVEGGKATFKFVVFGYLAWITIQAHWDELLSLAWTQTPTALSTVGDLLYQILMKISIAWIILAVADYIFQRKQTEKQLRMTKQELKQEMKEMEQSPELRMAMAQRRRKMSKGRMMDAVKSADVVITNPTHFSIAIKYEAGKMYAPQVVAKGQDLIALRMREVAKENRVPIVPNPPLARQLYKKCEVGDFVPRDLFQAVAEVLAYVYRTIKNVQTSG
jgi:flagellar biosynthesis protein FlhB